MKRGSLKVEVEDDHIVVVMEGSSLQTSYYLDKDAQKLVQSPAMEINSELPKRERREFEELTYGAATAKARELGWIG
jgi:hypothetical protein